MGADATIAAQLYAARRTRDSMFGADCSGFGEPAWDMLLALVAWGPASAERLVAVSAAEPDVAKRYVEWLTSRVLIEEQSGEGCKFHLAVRGQELMSSYLAQLRT